MVINVQLLIIYRGNRLAAIKSAFKSFEQSSASYRRWEINKVYTSELD